MNFMNVLKKFPLSAESIKRVKSNPGKFWLIVLFDVMFLATVYVLQNMGKYLAYTMTIPFITSFIVLAFIFFIAHYLLLLFAYSFFKYCILDSIRSLFAKSAFSFKRLGEFYALNISITAIFLIFIFVIGLALGSIKYEYAPYLFIVFAIAFFLILYTTLSLSHSFFYNGSSVIGSMKKGFATTFIKFRHYKEIILVMVIAALALWILFAGSGYIVRLVGSKNYMLYLNLYSYLTNATLVVLDILFYFVILINSISFYAVAKEQSQAP